MVHWNFGLAWVAFAVAVSLHVADEANHDFLSVYNPNALALRRRFHLPIPVFTRRVWLGGLFGGISLLLLLSPLAFMGARWLMIVAFPLSALVGIGNACLHIGGSVLYRRWLPGVLSSPILLIAGGWLLWCALEEAPALF